MQVAGDKFIFWDYIDDYGVLDERYNLIGFKADAPEAVKRSFEEFLKAESQFQDVGEEEELADD